MLNLKIKPQQTWPEKSLVLLQRLLLLAGFILAFQHFSSHDLALKTIILLVCAVITMTLLVEGGGLYGSQTVEQAIKREGDELVLQYPGKTGKRIAIDKIGQISVADDYISIIEVNNGNGYDIHCRNSAAQSQQYLLQQLGPQWQQQITVL
ncbi:hypothetical protein [Pseudoalteromonas 'SMAR']|uniref:hypothetical protein n=1 Tax=Pseudoalteromonas 'SMAR' TaxID=3416908 RepID=UPI003AF21B5B